MTKVKHGADAVALEQAIAAAEQRLLTAVDADDRGWQRLGAKEWRERIAASFASIRKLIPEILDPELDHRKWMANRYYRSGFELHAQGKSRNDSPYIEGVWTEQWQRGWDYADRSTKHTGSELPALEEITSLRAHNSDSAEPVAWGEFYGGTIYSVRMERSTHCTTPLYLASPPAKEVDLFELVRVAYFRGYQWCVENPDSPEYVAKAAYDYADKTTSALTNRTPDDEVGNG